MVIRNNNSGSVLLYSLLVMSLITAIAITISIIVVNGLRLSSGATKTAMAYYAAESGIERGLYSVKIFRIDSSKKLDDDGDQFNSTVHIIQGYSENNFDNNSSYTDESTRSILAETEKKEVLQNNIIQLDYFDVDSPLNPVTTIDRLLLHNTGSNLGSWAEVSWSAWQNDGTLATSENARKLIGPTDLSNGWPINLDVFGVGVVPEGYRVRVKALFGDISALDATPQEDAGDGNYVAYTGTDLNTRIEIKSVGKQGTYKQSLTANVPWNLPLYGLYDYVLYSEDDIIKTEILGREIYNSGVIQVEADIETVGTCTGCGGSAGDCSTLGWQAVCCDTLATCSIGSSEQVCQLTDSTTSKSWVLPVPNYVPAGEGYYLNLRAKYSTINDIARIILGDTCKELPSQALADEWFSCTIPDADFSTLANTNIQYELLKYCAGDPTIKGCKLDADCGADAPCTGGTIDVDWYQLSTYKLFDDCSSVLSCAVPTPTCGNCLCELGENCPADNSDCTGSQACKAPACNNGCGFVDVPDETVDPLCPGGDYCCTGSCTTPTCTVDLDCDDGNPGTVDTCINPSQCGASCSNI